MKILYWRNGGAWENGLPSCNNAYLEFTATCQCHLLPCHTGMRRNPSAYWQPGHRPQICTHHNSNASECGGGLKCGSDGSYTCRSLHAIGFAARADFRRLYPANAKTPTCCPSDDNRTKVTNSVTSARSLGGTLARIFGPRIWRGRRTPFHIVRY